MIKAYLEYQEKVKNLSVRTRQEYRKDLKVWAAWLKLRHLNLRQVTKAQIDAYLMDEHERGMKPETIKKRLTAVRVFYEWAWREGYTKENPARWCQSPKGEQRLPKTASVAQLDAYLNSPIQSLRSERVHLLVALLLETGLRLSEALNVRWRDIDSEQQTIHVVGKGRKERVVFYGHRLSALLDRCVPMGDHILTWRSDRRLREDLRNEVGDYVEGIHPHMLRHTYATALLNQGCPLKDVSVLMGHAHVTTTERYTRVATERLQTQYNNYQF